MEYLKLTPQTKSTRKILMSGDTNENVKKGILC